MVADATLIKNNIRALDFSMVQRVQVSAATENGEALALQATGKARKTSGATDGVIGIQVSTDNRSADAAADEWVGVVTLGLVTGFTDLVPGQLYYLSANAGNIADTGTIAVGYAWDATTLHVQPALADVPS